LGPNILAGSLEAVRRGKNCADAKSSHVRKSTSSGSEDKIRFAGEIFSVQTVPVTERKIPRPVGFTRVWACYGLLYRFRRIERIKGLQAGTRVAGDFLTSPQAINTALLGAPKGWEKRNLQIVLHATVINGSPNQPDVVATSYW
jgi:hypothetical protein